MLTCSLVVVDWSRSTKLPYIGPG